MTDHRLEVLAALADEIAQRKSASPDQSYTARLLSQGIEKCAKKFGEEAVETALAAVLRDKAQIAAETADLLYHLLVMLEASGVRLADVMAELARRQGMSGLAEKASRPKD
ncbi:MAG: phosphoribosyl-ATP diphosphatase [Aestuariivirga sp.]|jgi:phosphoribosyl-ATP pyrophosphohydrolase|nr:phosphoribosyl-ATP diphosphatase [Aestuariivirga sp.]